MKIPTRWLVLAGLLLLALSLSACQSVQPASKQPTRTAPDQPGQSPSAQQTASASEPGTADNPYMVRAIDTSAKFYGFSELGVVLSTQTKVVRSEMFVVTFNPAMISQVLSQLSVDKGLVLWALGDSLTATPQNDLVQYWVIPWDVALQGITWQQDVAVGKAVFTADTLVRSNTVEKSEAVRLTVTSDDKGCQGVVLAESFIKGVWKPFPIGDMRFPMPKSNCDSGSREITKDVIMKAIEQAGQFGLSVMTELLKSILPQFR